MPQLWVLPLLLAASGGGVSSPPPVGSSHLGMQPPIGWIAPRVARTAPPKAARIDSAIDRAATTIDTTAADTSIAVHAPILTRRDAWIAGAFVAATAVAMPFDQRITEEFRDPWPQQRTVFRDMASDFNFLGSPGVLYGSVAAYGIGRLSGSRRVAAMGLYSTEAIVLSGAVTGLIKGLAGRARPYVNDNDPDSFVLARGFNGGYASFPSGHSTAAFATAAVIAGESARWWPNAARFITPAAYGSAALVALSRIYSNKHWASDVIMGAGIGTLSGLAVVHFNEAHPRNIINRWLLGATIAPYQRGAVITWTIPTQ